MSDHDNEKKSSWLSNQALIQRKAIGDEYGGVGKQSVTEGLVNPTVSTSESWLVQRLRSSAHAVQQDAAENVQRAASDAGSPLPGGIREQFESSMGTDLSGVRVHTGPTSATAADSVAAKAYTTGQDIHFAAGSYNPSSREGQHLLAHEVAHTVQQSSGAAANPQYKLNVSEPGDAFERQADAVADRAVAGQSAADLFEASMGVSAGVQRKENGDQEEQSDSKAAEPVAPATSSADAPASTSPEVVTMDWNIDYQDTAGKVKGKMHDRYGDDQMIVKELKIDPDGKTKPERLRGGNMALSGDAYLGQVTVPKGSGKVTAAVQYAKKKDFNVALEVTPKPKGAAGAKLLKAATKQAQDAVMSMISDGRGDYGAMSQEVEQDLATTFEGATVKVLIKPHGKSKGGEVYVADGAPYNVDSNSEWAALVDPTGSSTNAVTWSTSSTEDHKSGESEEDGSKIHADVDTSTKVAEAEKFITSFKSSISTNVQHMVKNIQDTIIKADSNESKTETDETSWTIGIEPEKKDDKAAKKKSSGGGIVDKLKRGIKGGAKWLYNKGKGLVKKIPIVGTALDIAGDLWDTLTGRVKVERKSTDGDSTTKGSSTSVELKDAKEITDMSVIATELTNEFTTETSKEVETMVSTKFGVELSKVKKTDESSSTSTSKGASGSTVTVETGQPKVFIKRLK